MPGNCAPPEHHQERRSPSCLYAHTTLTATADIIAFLSDGVVLETGTHEQLLKKNKHYADFVRRQMGPTA